MILNSLNSGYAKRCGNSSYEDMNKTQKISRQLIRLQIEPIEYLLDTGLERKFRTFLFNMAINPHLFAYNMFDNYAIRMETRVLILDKILEYLEAK